MIKVTNLKKAFDGLNAVVGVSFEVSQNECLGLLGPNGAGKTTTIRMIGGLIRPDEGQIQLAGSSPHALRALRKFLGVVPQSNALYGNLSARENLEFLGRLYGLSGASLKDRVNWALAFAQLIDRQRDRVHKFSGGMQRRLSFACGLIHEPKILLLDEPLAGVDPQSRDYLLERIEELRGQGLAILCTTHDMEVAARICDRVAIMDHGRILAIDRVANLIQTQGGVPEIFVEFKTGMPWEGLNAIAEQGSRKYRIPTDEPLGAMARILERREDLISVSIEQPTLETVFLKLTGRSLRD